MVAAARVGAFLSRFRSTGTRVSGFGSRSVRNNIATEEGVRTIARREGDDGGGGFLSGLFSDILLNGWVLLDNLGIRGMSFGEIWGVIVQASQAIWNFNWNITDTQIDALLAQQKVILASYLGGTLGNLVGYLVCGVVPAATILTFNEPLGAYLLTQVGEEAFEEFSANLSLLLQASLRMLAQNIAYALFKNFRKGVREYLKDPNSAQSRGFTAIVGAQLTNALRNWGAEGSQPWSFAIALENWIESLNNPVLEAFWEEFFEETGEACIEAGYVIANGLDSWIAMNQLNNATQNGAETVVQLQPDREVEGESIIVAAPRTGIRQALVGAMAAHTLIDNRDVGMWVGQPLRESLDNVTASIQLVIALNSVQYSPHKTAEGKAGKKVTVTIPNVSRAKVDWQRIKLAAGGSNGYMWGQYLAAAKLTRGYRIQCYAATEGEAVDRVKAYALLSDSEILTINVTREVKEANRAIYDSLNKRPTRIYPVSFTILNQIKVLNEESGRANPSGVYQSRQYKIPLNVDVKPDDFETLVNQLFYIPGPNG